MTLKATYLGRLNARQIRKAKELCETRDGEGCRKKGTEGHVCRGALVLHHRNGDPSFNPRDGSNWEILCWGENVRLGVTRRRSRAKFSSHLRFKDSMKKQELDGCPVRGISAELKKAEIIRPMIEDWVISEIIKNGKLELSEAILSGSYKAKCHKNTIRGYIESFCSKAGPFEIVLVDEVEYITLKRETRREETKTVKTSESDNRTRGNERGDKYYPDFS